MQDYLPPNILFSSALRKEAIFSNRDNCLKTINIKTIIFYFKNIIINIRYHSYDRNQSVIIEIKFMLTDK